MYAPSIGLGVAAPPAGATPGPERQVKLSTAAIGLLAEMTLSAYPSPMRRSGGSCGAFSCELTL